MRFAKFLATQFHGMLQMLGGLFRFAKMAIGRSDRHRNLSLDQRTTIEVSVDTLGGVIEHFTKLQIPFRADIRTGPARAVRR
jgi:hypothetical protein